MEGYKDIIGKAAAPPLGLLLFLAGTIMSSYGFHLSRHPEAAAGLALLLSGAGLAPVIVRRIPAVSRGRYALHCVLLALLALAVTVTPAVYIWKLTAGGTPRTTEGTYRGTVSAVTEHRYSRELALELSGEGGMPVKAAAYADFDREYFKGQEITVRARPLAITDEAAAENPFDLTKVRKGIRHVFFLREYNHETAGEKPPSIREKVRNGISSRVDTLFPGPAGRVIKALYFGNKDYIDKKTLNEYKRAGVLHVLAASGLHIGIIASIPFFLLGLIGLPKKHIFAAALAVLAAYLFMTDMPVSLIRAFLMFSVYAIQKLLDMEGNVFSALFIAAVFILVGAPHELYSLGFQLSFGATLGIILFFRNFRESVSFLPKMVSGPLAVTLSAQIIVIPVILAQLKEINFIGVVSNLVVVPGTALALVSSIFAGSASMVSMTIGGAAAEITSLIFTGNAAAVRFLSALNGHFAAPDVSLYHLAPLALLAVPLLPFKRARKAGFACILAAYCIGWGLFSTAKLGPVLSELPVNERLTVRETGGAVTISGSLAGREEANLLARTLERGNSKEISIHIADPGYRSVMNFTGLVKSLPVTRCSIVPGRENNAVRKLRKILARDGIDLVISRK